MRVSLNTVKQFVDFELPPVDELVKRINQQLGGVEEVVDLGAKYKDAKIVKIVECEKHPNADRLSVCRIDAGSGDLIQVVCGAPNVRTDMWAVWLPPASTVPSTYGTDEPFVLGARELRGVMSNGMLAAGDELGINNDHDGIIEITTRDIPDGMHLEVGGSFAAMFGLDDTLIDIENKMFTHRPDLFGQLGVAREISAILKGLRSDNEDTADIRFENPEWYWQMPQFDDARGLELAVFNDVPEKVPRLMAVAMKNVTIAPSPLWLQTTLLRWGSKSINTVVDCTNYIMLLTAQPTHAYDYDKLHGHMLGARMAKKGETVELLNGKTYKLDETDIVIADAEGPVGLGGIMGGMYSEVSDTTSNIVLECANFDMYAVRRSSMRHGIFTDALTRFNKGQSPLQNNRVLYELMRCINLLSGGEQASTVYDLPDRSNQLDEVSLSNELPVATQFINQRLGTDLTTQDVGDLLRRANFASYPSGHDSETLLITAPFWRTDIVEAEDIVEEVGRLYGFDKLPRQLPSRSIAPVAKNTSRVLKQSIRDSLSRAGANEVLTYSFVHKNVLTGAGQDPTHAYRLSNALSPELQYYRLSLMPSLLDKVHMNIKAGNGSFALYEIGKSHCKGEMDANDPNVPNEDTHVALVVAANDKERQPGAPFYLARTYLEQIARLEDFQMVAMASFDMSNDVRGQQLSAMYAPSRAMVIVKDDQIWGVVGEYAPAVQRRFKLPMFAAGFEVHLSMLQQHDITYASLSRYPSVTQDISLAVATDCTYNTVFERLLSSLITENPEVRCMLHPITIYQGIDDQNRKTLTFRVTVTSDTHTLQDSMVTAMLHSAVEQLARDIPVAVA